MRLICFPYAGGSAAVFRGWQDLLGPQVEVCALELPGRGRRLREPPVHDLTALAHAITADIAPALQFPHAFFGHSLGGLLAFEVARERRRNGAALPALFVASGCRAPHQPRSLPDRRDLPHAEFIAALGALGGTPAQILAEPDLLRLLAPMLRADFALSETYVHVPEPPLPIALLVLGGTRDAEIPREHLLGWQDHFATRAEIHLLEGDHFFLHARQDQVCAILRAHLAAG